MSAYLLTENFFDTRQFPGHTVTGEDEETGHEGFRVATARRHPRDYYTPQTANVARYLEASCDRVRLANTLVLDRGHNLAGETVRLWASNQAAFPTKTEWAFTVPSAVSYNNKLIDGHPVLTTEGAVVLRFEGAGKFWRVEVDAMGATLKPRIVGAWLGNSFDPQTTPLPYDDEPRWLDQGESQRGVPSSFSDTGRATTVNIRMKNEAEWAEGRYTLQQFWAGRKMWYVPDHEQGERTWLAYSPSGVNGAPNTTGKRTVALNLSEYDPVRL